MNIKQRILELYTIDKYNPLYIEEMMEILGIDKDEREMLEIALGQMVNDGQLVKTRKGKFAIPEILGMFAGRIQGNSKGYGFFIPDNREQEDIFIPPEHMNGAMHGDRVLIKLLGRKSSEGMSREGEVIAILERANKTIVGTFEREKNFGFVIPDNPRISNDIFIPKDGMGEAQTGHKVVVEVTRWPERRRNPEGRIIEILGHKNDAGTDILSIIRQFDLPEDFPREVLNEARAIPQRVEENQIRNRLDIRDMKLFTIDGEDAKDFDDAVSIEVLPNGNYRLGVHIADVTYYVKEGSSIDREAYKRGTSIYLVDRVIPMLPKELSNGICSLNPNEDRLAITVFMEIDHSGKVVDYTIHESVIRSKARMIYDDVTQVLEANDLKDVDRNIAEYYEPFLNELKLMEELCGILRRKRHSRGSIDFDIDETKIVLDEKGRPISVAPEKRGISNRIIEEFMIACNETIAEYIHWSDMPFIYRIHEEPDSEKVAAFNEFIYNFGYHLKGVGGEQIHPKVFQELLNNIEGRREERIIRDVMLRSMQKAIYSPYNVGHFGLASEFYCHFTSPIRRYPDLMIHRIIKAFINGGLNRKEIERLEGKLPEISDHCSKQERVAEEAERETENLKKCEFMLDKIGCEYEGIISGVTNYGLYVQLPNTVEGLIKFSTMEDDYYIYDEKHYCAIGEHTRKIYRLGDPIKVKVSNVDMYSRNIDFLLAE